MSAAADEIIGQALSLPPEEGVRVAEELLRSLEGPEQAEIDAAWAEEAERRIDALEAGHMTATPGDEVFARLMARKK